MTDWQRRLPPLATLAPFEAAFRHRNFTRAAAELHFSQATISRRISELEADLGVILFERGRHDVRPTADAQSLANAVRFAFGELATSAEVVRRRGSRDRTLTIYSDLSLATTVIAPLLGDYQRRHPELEIRVLSSFEPIETTQEDFDVGIQYGRDEVSSLIVEPIADDNVFPVCSPAFARRLPPAPTGADLAALPLLHVDYAERAWVDWHQFLTFVGADPPTTIDGLRFTSYLVCLDVAERGEGLALGWARTVRPRLDSGRLVAVAGLTMPRPNAISAYRPSSQRGNPNIDEFLTMLKGRLPTSAGDSPGQ